ncbi:MAG: hypothetical protein R3E66_13440 [bacterium]
MTWRWVVVVMLASVNAWAQEVTTVSLVTDAACADVGGETDFVRELRQRLPDARFILGVDTNAAWQLTWRPDGETCVVEVVGLELATIALPKGSTRGDLELAASQVAWIVTMATAPVEPAPDPAVEAATKSFWRTCCRAQT